MELANLLPPQSFDSDPILDFEADLEEAAHALDLEPWVLQRLKYPEREITVNLPLLREDGGAANITGYRIQHSRAHGPSIGPVTLSPMARPAELRTTAATITLQSALLGLRLGGAAGAIVCDPAQCSERELRRAIRGYVTALRDDTGPLLDVLAPQGPAWMIASTKRIASSARGASEPGAAVGGSAMDRATASAMVSLLRRALNRDDLAHLRIAIQGFGRRGRTLAHALRCEGAILVGISDRSGAVMRQDGIDLSALEAFVSDTGVIYGFPNADAASNADLLESECDVLVLAAAPRQVGSHNISHLRARTIVELTQNALALPENSLPGYCLVLPFLLAGLPELAVWSYEWQRGLSYSNADDLETARDASARVAAAFKSVRGFATVHGTGLHLAGRMVALDRLACTLRLD